MKALHAISLLSLLFAGTTFANTTAKRDLLCTATTSNQGVVKILFKKDTDSNYTQSFKVFGASKGFDVTLIRQKDVSTAQYTDRIAIAIVANAGVGLIPSQLINGVQYNTEKGAPLVLTVDAAQKSTLRASANFTAIESATSRVDVTLKCQLLDEGTSTALSTGVIPLETTLLGPTTISADSSKVDSSSTVAPKARTATDIGKSFGSKVNEAK